MDKVQKPSNSESETPVTFYKTRGPNIPEYGVVQEWLNFIKKMFLGNERK
jgi:hypothetical protein